MRAADCTSSSGGRWDHGSSWKRGRREGENGDVMAAQVGRERGWRQQTSANFSHKAILLLPSFYNLNPPPDILKITRTSNYEPNGSLQHP